MPKRRLTPKRKAQIKLWEMQGALASARARHGYSHPSVTALRNKIDYHTGKLGGYTPPGLGGRRTKQGGKAYVKKTASNFTPHQEALDIIKGKTTLAATALGHPAPPGGKVPVPKNSWRSKPSGAKLSPSKVHGSGTGLSSAFRYGPANPANKRRGK
ncbi:MAG: hypothetical protein JOY77_09030 [Alphaproteobacteria bacterium]|nr:hypothetical protein [Alphaproteobacteria bacterium]